MAAKTRNISTLIESQLPGFILQDYSKFKTFIEKYYEQQEVRGQPLDIISNITSYRNIDFYDKNILKEKTTLPASISSSDTTIVVVDATSFPENNGYIKINDEICFYKERTDTEFLEVSRGVSGNTVLGDLYSKSEFVTTESSSHNIGSEVLNISNLFLYAFVRNFEKEYLGAFPEKYLKNEIDKRTLIKNIGDFYKAKGTEKSIKFLFNTIISKEPGEEVSVYNPKDYTLKSSVSDWISSYTLRIRVLSGDPSNLVGNFISQGSATAVVDNVDAFSNSDGLVSCNLVLAPETINGEFEVSPRASLRRSLPASYTRGDKVTVFSTEGFPQEGTVIIGNNKFDYSSKTINQFLISSREPTNANYNYGTKLYSANTAVGTYSSGTVEFIVDGIIYNLLPRNPKPYSESGDTIQVFDEGVSSSDRIIKKTDNEVRWFLNSTYQGTNSLYPFINNQLPQVISDVAAIYEDDLYFYIASSSYPSVTELLNSNVTENLKDQELLKLIRKQPITTTEVYSTGNKDVGILVDGSPVYSNRSKEEIVFGQIETIKILTKGRNYVVAPTVLVNEQPNKAYARLSGETVGDILISSSDVYSQDPEIRITAGEGSILSPVVTNGEITSIKVDNPGKYYSSPPTLVITDLTGKGGFAEYEAIINNEGEIIDCVKINGGKLYDNRFTSVVAVPAGTGATASCKVKRWTKDRYRSLVTKIDTNNSYVFENYNGYGYGVLANPKVLRRRIGDSINGVYEETPTLEHSPILGYAYDGNPIYGPYGYIDPLNATSQVTRMNSGYALNSSRPNGPSIINYPLGTFVEDYTWIPSVNSEKTELDLNNGRFCVTPDYPEGVYAYFVTMDADQVPQFPYILGKNFYSLPVDSNYNSPISQRDLPNNVKRLTSDDFETTGGGLQAKIKDITKGFVNSADVYSSALNFSVGNSIFSNGAVVSAVDSVKGKEVVSIKSDQDKIVEINTINTVYIFANDVITQTATGASGTIILDTPNGNKFVLKDVVGEFSTEETIDAGIDVVKFILDTAASYTIGSTISFVDTEAATITATGEVLESTIEQNSVIIKVLSGTFTNEDNFYIKSSTLSDTQRAGIINITSLSKDINIFTINDKVALLETTEPHGISIGDKITVDINPDPVSTETTFYVRKKLYQTMETVPVSHNSVIIDTGIGSGDVLTTGLSYVSGTYENVELVFRDSSQARFGVGLPGDSGNARATIVVGNQTGSGFGSVSSVTITSKGSNYRPQDILTFVENDQIVNVDPGNIQRFAFVVDHVGFAAENKNLFLSNVTNLSNGDFLQLGPEIVEIESVNLFFNSVTVNRGRKGTIPTNHFDGNKVTIEEAPFRFTEGYQPLETGSNQPLVKSYNQETNELIISYNYGDLPQNINRIASNSVFFDQSSPKKVVVLRNVESATYKLEISKFDENNFTVNPELNVQKFYTYKFDTSHYSMANTYLDISPSINYNILVDGKEVSTLAPGQPGSYVKIRFGFEPDVDPNNEPEKIDLRYSIFYYFIKAFGVDTSGSKINIINDPLAGVKTVTYKTDTGLVYYLDNLAEYDGSGEITYTTSSKTAIGEVNSISIINSRSDLESLPTIVGCEITKEYRSDAEALISNGKIVSGRVKSPGSNYVNPVIVIEGDGEGAVLKPFAIDGKIVSIVTLNGGKNYTYANLYIIEGDFVAYYKSPNIGLPKNVTIIQSGLGYTSDYTITPKFTSKVVLVLTDCVNFSPEVGVVQLSSGAKGKITRSYWKKGSNLLKLENIEGSFVVGQEIKSLVNGSTATVKEVLLTDFTEEIKTLKEFGGFLSDKGKIGDASQKIHDSYFYQDYSYVVSSKTSIDDWRDLILETSHPAGFKVFGQANIFSTGAVPMPESEQTIETVCHLNIGVTNISSYNTSVVNTLIINRFTDFRFVTGDGAIGISDVDLTTTFFQDIVLGAPFDGYIDPDTGKREGTKTFTLYSQQTGQTLYPYNEEQLVITIDGILQEPGVAYTISGDTITFDTAPLGPRIAEGQEVDEQYFYGKQLRFIDDSLNQQYFRKIKNISPEFDNIKSEFDLYYENGDIVKTDIREFLIVVIDGVKQVYNEAYTIQKFEDPGIPDKIVFTKKPELEDPLYDSEDPRENSTLRLGQKCFIYSVGNYFTATIDTEQIPTKPNGPFNYSLQSFLATDTLNGKVVNVPDPLYALVFVDNVLQIPRKSYNITGSLITFKSKLPYSYLPDGSLLVPRIEILYLYGKNVTSTLTAYNFAPETYYRNISLSLDQYYVDEWNTFWHGSFANDFYADEGTTSGVYVYDKAGDPLVYGELQANVLDRGSDYFIPTVFYSDIPFYSQPTQTFVVSADLNGDFLIDGVLQAPLTLIAGHTYRFNISDPSLLSHEFAIQALNVNFSDIGVIDKYGSDGTANSSLWLTLFPTAEGVEFEYFDLIGLTIPVSFFPSADDGLGKYGYGFVATSLTQLNGQILYVSYQPNTLIGYENSNFNPGDILVNPDFKGKFDFGDGGVTIELSRAEERMVYPIDNSSEFALGYLKYAKETGSGSLLLSIETDVLWNDEILEDKVVVIKRKNNHIPDRDFIYFTFRGDYTLSYTEPQTEAGRILLERNSTWWLGKGENDDACYYHRTRLLKNLHPGDEILLTGETSTRKVLSVPRYTQTNNFNLYSKLTEHSGKITTTPYNGITYGEGLSIYAQINANGEVVDLIWNRDEWDEEFTTKKTTAKDYTGNLALYFVPRTNSGGGARGNVSFYNGVLSVNLESGGYGYQEPPLVVVARPYIVAKDPNRYIDTVSLLRVCNKYLQTTINRIISIIDVIQLPGPTVAEFISLVLVVLANDADDTIITTIVEPDVLLVDVDDEVISKFTFILNTLIYEAPFDGLDVEHTCATFIESEDLTVRMTDFSDTSVNFEYQILTSETFLGTGGSTSDIVIPLESNFLIGDSILYVTNTSGFPQSGTLLIDFEKVTYDGIERDRFFITERGTLKTNEVDHFVPNFVRLVNNDIFIRDLDTNIAIETLFGNELQAGIIGGGLVQPRVTWIDAFEASVRLPDNDNTSLVEIVTVTINAGIEKIQIEFQQGGVIVIPGVIIPIQIDVIVISPVTVSVEVFLVPFALRFEDSRIVPFNITKQWTRILEDSDTLVSFDDVGGSIVDVVEDGFVYQRIWTVNDVNAERNPLNIVTIDIDSTLDQIHRVWSSEVDPTTFGLNAFVARQNFTAERIKYNNTFYLIPEILVETDVYKKDDPIFTLSDGVTPQQLVFIDQIHRIDNILPLKDGLRDETFITLIINPVENVTIQGVYTEVVGPEIVDVEIEEIVNVIRIDAIAQSPLQANLLQQLRANTSVNPADYLDGQLPEETEVQIYINHWSGGSTTREGYQQLDPVTGLPEELATPWAGDNTQGLFWMDRQLQPLRETDSVISIRTVIEIDRPIRVDEQEFYALLQSPVRSNRIEQLRANTSLNPADYLDGQLPTETEVQIYINHWSGGSRTREGYEQLDPETGLPELLATPWAGDNTEALFWMERQLQPVWTYDFGIIKQITRFYPDKHLLGSTPEAGSIGGDPDPVEGFYGLVSMPNIVTFEVFYTASIPGGQDKDPNEEFVTIDPRLADLQSVEFWMDRILQVQVDKTDISVNNYITRFYPNQHLLGSTPEAGSIGGDPDPTEGFYAKAVSPVQVIANFNDYIKKSDLPAEYFLEDPAVFSEFVTVSSAEIERFVTRITTILDDVKLDAGFEFQYIHTRGIWTVEPLIQNLEVDTKSTKIIKLDLVNTTIDNVEAKRSTEIVTGIADSIDDEYGNRYLRTTLGQTFAKFESNNFVSNGSLNINGSIVELLGSVEVGEFLNRENSSIGSTGKAFNIAIPSINELGAKLQTDLLIGENTITVSTVLDGPNSLWPTSGTLMIGNDSLGTLEEVQYTGISGNTFTGVTRGIRGNEVDHIIPAEIPGDGIDQAIYVRTIG